MKVKAPANAAASAACWALVRAVYSTPRSIQKAATPRKAISMTQTTMNVIPCWALISLGLIRRFSFLSPRFLSSVAHLKEGFGGRLPHQCLTSCTGTAKGPGVVDPEPLAEQPKALTVCTLTLLPPLAEPEQLLLMPSTKTSRNPMMGADWPCVPEVIVL